MNKIWLARGLLTLLGGGFFSQYSVQSAELISDGAVAAVPIDVNVASDGAPKLRGVDAPTRVRGQYIVVLKDSSANEFVHNKRAANIDEAVASFGRELTWKYGGQISFHYGHALKGFAVTGLSDADAVRMARDPVVDFVETDQLVDMFQTQSPVGWGLDRIDQRNLPLSNSYNYSGTGAGVNVYVIDSGIYANSDFGTRLRSGYTAINDGYGTSDCAGHGTAVAGVIGGATYGVAKGVNLYPSRVFGCDATNSPTSVIVAGINWVAANHVSPAVANMSLGGSANSSLDAATNNLINSGVVVVVAAGNSSIDACNVSPARVAAAITVGGTTINDQMYSLSNFGGCVKVYAPAENIETDSNLAPISVTTLSGTSVASPHVAGVAALMKAANPSATPATIAWQIRDGATTNKIVNFAEPTYCTNANPLLYSGVASPPGSPTTPAGLASERICYGRYRMYWSPSTGVSDYEVYKTESAQSGCEGYVLSTTLTNIQVSAGTIGGSTTFRVRACNATGCSSYSSPTTVSYYTGCR